jgi:hypothetical protein
VPPNSASPTLAASTAGSELRTAEPRSTPKPQRAVTRSRTDAAETPASPSREPRYAIAGDTDHEYLNTRHDEPFGSQFEAPSRAGDVELAGSAAAPRRDRVASGPCRGRVTTGCGPDHRARSRLGQRWGHRRTLDRTLTKIVPMIGRIGPGSWWRSSSGRGRNGEVVFSVGMGVIGFVGSVRLRFERVEVQAGGAGVDGPVGDSR